MHCVPHALKKYVSLTCCAQYIMIASQVQMNFDERLTRLVPEPQH